MSDYKPGDRIKVTYEGVLDENDYGDVGLNVGPGKRLWADTLAAGTVEVIAPPLEYGDVVVINDRDASHHYLTVGTLAVVERLSDETEGVFLFGTGRDKFQGRLIRQWVGGNGFDRVER